VAIFFVEENRMLFEKDYDLFMQDHLKHQSGESKRRLKEGHGHAEKLFLEKVWWPSFGNFLHLHPEFEVQDFKDGYRFLDFAYILPSFRACFEIDGYGPHWRDANRRQFADHLTRQNHLIIDGWKVIRFAYDEVNERPRHCQQIIQQLMGRWLGEMKASEYLTSDEKEIMRLAARTAKPITPGEASAKLKICRKTAQKLLHQLAEKHIFNKIGGSVRTRAFQLNPNKWNDDIL
jgi:very-short-patch-repair endonuclease